MEVTAEVGRGQGLEGDMGKSVSEPVPNFRKIPEYPQNTLPSRGLSPAGEAREGCSSQQGRATLQCLVLLGILEETFLGPRGMFSA